MTKLKKGTQDPFVMSMSPKADMLDFESIGVFSAQAHKHEGKIYPLLKRIMSKTRGMLSCIF